MTSLPRTLSRRQPGFTILELSIVMVIIGIMLSIGMPLVGDMLQGANMSKDRMLQQRASDALVAYVAANHRLPCPDTGTTGSETTLGSGCKKPVGNLPYKVLNLADGNDAYGRQISYGVYNSTTTNVNLHATSYSSLGTFCIALQNAISATAAGDLTQVYIDNSNQTPAPSSTHTTNQAFILASGGNVSVLSDGNFFDGLNRNSDTNGVQFDDPSTSAVNTKACTTTSDGTKICYDDLVSTMSFSELYGRLNCGAAQSNAALRIVTDALPVGTKNSPYPDASAKLSIYATGGVPDASGNYWWCYVAPSIPSGLTLAGGAVGTTCASTEFVAPAAATLDILGTPTTAGGPPITVFVLDTFGTIVSRKFTLTINN